uniref:Uncharacterized protein n=1 Tax=Anguilla anguilla TaxID=7936 RepID=A0A0E9QMC2_ANGAN
MYCKLHQLIGFTVSGGHLSLVVRSVLPIIWCLSMTCALI